MDEINYENGFHCAFDGSVAVVAVPLFVVGSHGAGA